MCDWSGENWRWYINDLEDRLHKVGRGAIATPIDRLPTPTPLSTQPKVPSPPASPLSRASTFVTLSGSFMRSSIFSPKSLSPRSTWGEEQPLPLPAHACQSSKEDSPSLHGRQMKRKLISLYRTLYSQAIRIQSHVFGSSTDRFSAADGRQVTEENVDSVSTIEPPELPPNFSPTNIDQPPETLDFSDLQKVQFVEEKTQDVSLHLKFNMEVLQELREYYQDVVNQEGFPVELKENCRDDLSKFNKRVLGLTKEMRMLRARTDNLLELTSNRKQLVKGILEYKSIQANEYFAKKSQQSADNMEIMTRKMRVTAEKTERETVSMRVITSVTLFFLPATFLASFMSTDILSFETGSQELRMKGLWLYLELALPATALTFIVWGVIYHWAKKASRSSSGDDNIGSLPV
ncbi:hypothetical protein GRF29_112g123521 [Pseudopithomyces chartarum]|uniref:CorA-like transporter domain-containing protein n=1 Tax=Pseudopithomyces chartarum TaxID=1892770 RepID=A0AAN6LS53_9PLEO|nr:hypothetical protein GRF29_112g123521 [Pseudopithomyces chartarum]